MANDPGGHGAPPSIGLGTSLVAHLATRVQPRVIPEEELETWIMVQHTRPWPGDQDPKTRQVTEPRGVLSEYTIYDEKGAVLAKGKLSSKEGEPERVSLPPDASAVTVMYEHDYGKEHTVAHVPLPHGLTDPTQPPSPDQQAKISDVGVV